MPAVVGGSLALVGVGLGRGYRLAASSKQDDVNALREETGSDGCATANPPGACDDLKSAADGVDMRRNVSTAGFVVAGAALVGTAVYWLWPRSKREATASQQRRLVVIAVG